MDLINSLKNIILEVEINSDLSSSKKIRLQIFLTSFTILFFELFCVRWLPAYVRFLSYFTNVIILASFLGIGLGILLSRRKRFILPSFPIWLFILVAVTIQARFTLYLPSTQVLYFAAGEYVAPPENGVILPILFFLVTVAFMILARPLGKLLKAIPPLQAYTWDILGSLAGVATFFIISYLSLPPFIWSLILFLLIWVNTQKQKRIYSIPFFIGVFLIVFVAGKSSIWSPYYRIQVNPAADGSGYLINVNNIAHQVVTHYENKEDFYFRVYDLFKGKTFKKVLILGAGSGSDVAIALHQGAEQVDAAEIDPALYQLGVTLNPDHPYEDLRVKVYITDGRSFLRNKKTKYDLIIFALTDSLTLTSGYSSLRLESFLLTTDSLENAKSLLNDDGSIVLYNYYRQDWLIQKLAGMMNDVFGSAPYITTYGEYGHAAVLIDGPGLANLDKSQNIRYNETVQEDISSQGTQLPIIGYGRMPGDPHQALATDDWPFVYMQVHTIPTLYLSALGLLLLITLLMSSMVIPKETIKNFDWHFFFLGVAFLLLETRSLTTFGLIFGNTWIVNSLVFFGILSSVLLAILLNGYFKKIQPVWMYSFLIIALLLNYLIPLKLLLDISNQLVRYMLAAILTFSPIFCANIVFSRDYESNQAADIAFASNMLGAMIGGMLEYVSLAFGYRALILLVIFLYIVAYITLQKQKGPGSSRAFL